MQFLLCFLSRKFLRSLKLMHLLLAPEQVVQEQISILRASVETQVRSTTSMSRAARSKRFRRDLPVQTQLRGLPSVHQVEAPTLAIMHFTMHSTTKYASTTTNRSISKAPSLSRKSASLGSKFQARPVTKLS